jgi:hypothetical protein
MNHQKGFIGVVFLVIAGFFALAVLGSAMNLITIPWLKFNKQVQTNRDIVEKTYNADNALYNYRWFKDRHEAIKAAESKVRIAKDVFDDFQTSAGARASWTFEDKTESARLSAVFTGLKMNYEDLVAEYNSRAKQADRAIFQNELPLFFSLNAY